MEKKKKLTYHWVIFAIGFMMVFFALGFNSSIKSTYMKSITQWFGWDRAAFEVGSSIRYITTAVLNIFFGTLVAKFGTRKLIGAGFISLSAYCIISATSTSLMQIYIANFFFGCGLAWSTTTIVGVLVEKWFTNSKGSIMGIILAANGLGGFVAEFLITPFVYGPDGKSGWVAVEGEPVISEGWKGFWTYVSNGQVFDDGWRVAYLITACIMLLVGFLAVVLIRNTPEEKGIDPLGKGAVAKKKRGADWVGFDMKDILKKKYFYIAAVCVFITGFVLNSFNGNAKPHMQDAGLDSEYIIVVFSIHSLVLTVSKILAGKSFDKFGIRFTFGYCSVAAIVSLVALFTLNAQSVISPWIYSIVSSIALPLETIMIPLMVAEIFGKKCYSQLMGWFLGINTLGYALGAIVVNLFYDWSVVLFCNHQLPAGEICTVCEPSYKEIFMILCVVLAINLIVVQLVFAAAKKDRVRYEAKLAAQSAK
jgi:MFS family permease